MKLAWLQGIIGAITGAAAMWVFTGYTPPVRVSGTLEMNTSSRPALPGPYVNSRIYVMRDEGLTREEFGKLISGAGRMEVKCNDLGQKEHCYPVITLQ